MIFFLMGNHPLVGGSNPLRLAHPCGPGSVNGGDVVRAKDSVENGHLINLTLKIETVRLERPIIKIILANPPITAVSLRGIGRVSALNPAARKQVAEALATEQDLDFGEWKFERIDLMQSVISRQGAVYGTLESIRLESSSAGCCDEHAVKNGNKKHD